MHSTLVLLYDATCNYPAQAFAVLVTLLAGRTLTVEYVARDPDGRAMEERNAPQNRAGRQGRQHSPPPRRVADLQTMAPGEVAGIGL